MLVFTAEEWRAHVLAACSGELDVETLRTIAGAETGQETTSGPDLAVGAASPENGSEAAAPIVTVFGQLRSGEIHEFGTVDSDAGDTAQDVMASLAALLRECADYVPTVVVDPELGPDAAGWSPRDELRQDEETPDG